MMGFFINFCSSVFGGMIANKLTERLDKGKPGMTDVVVIAFLICSTFVVCS